MSLLYWIITIICLLISLICLKLKTIYNYWTKHGIKGPKPSLVFGTVKDVLTMKLAEPFKNEEIYNCYKDEKIVGLYFMWKPQLLIRDETLIKKITVSDFDSFSDHPSISTGGGSDSILHSIFVMEGQMWKERRQLFTKFFTPKKLKEKFSHLKEVSKNLFHEDLREIDLESLMQKYTLRAFLSVFYDIDITKSEKDELMLTETSMIFAAPGTSSVLKSLTFMLFPKIFRIFNMRTWPVTLWKNYASFSKKMLGMYENNKELENNNNFINLLVKMKNEGTPSGEKIGFPEVVGHIFSFFIAGHHTTQYTLCYVILQLSLYPEIQNKLKNEVDEILKDSEEITYEALSKMTYMDQVIAETLRLYPLLGLLKRVCTKEYKIDENYTIPKGMDILLPISAYHHDPKYFPEPFEFKPERFSDTENTQFVYMPFGKGPRICLGMRFAELEMKYCLAVLLSLYTIRPSPKMKLPLKYDPNVIFITYKPIEPMLVEFEKRNNPIFKL